jgi:CrcB protein
MKAIVLVFLGGGIGSSIRYLIGKHLNPANTGFPWGTFVVNLIGSLLIGLIFGWMLQKTKLSNELTLFLVAGFCGGFTTFSAFAHESLNLLRYGYIGLFAGYAFGSLILGLGCVWLGYVIAKTL